MSSTLFVFGMPSKKESLFIVGCIVPSQNQFLLKKNRSWDWKVNQNFCVFVIKRFRSSQFLEPQKMFFSILFNYTVFTTMENVYWYNR